MGVFPHQTIGIVFQDKVLPFLGSRCMLGYRIKNSFVGMIVKIEFQRLIGLEAKDHLIIFFRLETEFFSRAGRDRNRIDELIRQTRFRKRASAQSKGLDR